VPAVEFNVRWPGGGVQRCYSPSRAIEDALTAGASYPVKEFVARSRGALEEGSRRVRSKYGFACTASMAQAASIERTARDHPSDGLVLVETLKVDDQPAAPEPAELPDHVPVVVVGGGQAGLSASWHLAEQGIEHVILERHRIANSWREDRWDSFCLVTPNWQCRLPGHPYHGGDPDGFMVRDEIVDYVEAFARKLDPPILEGVAVHEVREGEGAPFALSTSSGELTSDQVILAVGGYHTPKLPGLSERVPPEIAQLHTSRYKNPSALPDGAVLVVGNGQSGAQIAEDLHREGRDVHLAVGTAPRMARFYRGRDVVAWMADLGHYDLPIDEHELGLEARKEANHYVTGRDGGHDIDLRQFAVEGMRLHGRLVEIRDGGLRFADDLSENLDNADRVADRAKDAVDQYIERESIDAPTEARYEPVWHPDGSESAPLDLAEAGIRTVIWATGFTSNWSWVKLPAFDGTNYPAHQRGVTSVPGLYVLGLPWLYSWGSGRFAGIARDAEQVVAQAARGASGFVAARQVA